MKSFEVPLFLTSLVGLCFLSGLDTTPAYGDFTFGEPEKVARLADSEWIDCFSYYYSATKAQENLSRQPMIQ
jgi:hypothetical protein